MAATRWWSGHELAKLAQELVPGSVERADDVAAYFRAETLVETMRALRDSDDGDFVYLINLCAADYWSRFEVVYHIASLQKNHAAVAKVEVFDRENPVVPSVVPVWYGAWMQECEAYDLFGIRFEGHPKLYRILLWEGFPGWPLRKDFLSLPGGIQPGLNEFSGTARREPPPVRYVE